VCGNHTLRVKSHCSGGNTLVRVDITLVLVVIADFFFSFLGGVLLSLLPPPHGSALALVRVLFHSKINKNPVSIDFLAWQINIMHLKGLYILNYFYFN
jgi:hypothetical protein